MSLEAFHIILNGPLKRYAAFSNEIGDSVMLQSIEVEAAFQAQYNFLYMSMVQHQKPNLDIITRLVGAAQKVCMDNVEKVMANHLSMIGESIPALGWMQVREKPGDYVKEMKNTAVYYGNRVRNDFKRTGNEHVEWVKAWLETLDKLHAFIQEYHPNGLLFADAREQVVLNIDDLSITQEELVGSGDANRNEGWNKTKKGQVLKQPVLVQEGKKWIIMDYKNRHDLVIDVPEIQQVVYMFRCQDVTLTVRGKLNSITVDCCNNSSLIFDSLLSSVDFINCKKVEMQVFGTVPMIIVDKTESCQVYLSNESLSAEIISSQCSQLNILLPQGLDYKECPVPEQIKTTVGAEGKLKFAVVQNNG